MENASKALLIAGTVLIAIVLIALGVKLLSNSGDITDKAEKVGETISSAAGTQADKVIGSILGGKKIHFTFMDSVELEATEGMTWGEWCESDYYVKKTKEAINKGIEQNLFYHAEWQELESIFIWNEHIDTCDDYIGQVVFKFKIPSGEELAFVASHPDTKDLELRCYKDAKITQRFKTMMHIDVVPYP